MLDLNLSWRVTRSIAVNCEKDEAFYSSVMEAMKKFLKCDWGEVPQEDKEANDRDLSTLSGRLVARYHTNIDEDIYIICDDWENAVILFCSEY